MCAAVCLEQRMWPRLSQRPPRPVYLVGYGNGGRLAYRVA
jgi:hypothetical protein